MKIEGFISPMRRLYRRLRPRPNPRPVRVDEQGRLYEMTGEPIVIEGLEPEKILQGIADELAGRTRPLREIIAERNRCDTKSD